MVTATALEGHLVNTLFKDCLSTPMDRTSEKMSVQGITKCAVFNEPRIEEHRAEIHNFLAQLPSSFKATEGGGDSIKNATKDYRGTDWTGPSMIDPIVDVEQLMQLGVAIGEVRYLNRDPEDGSARFVVQQ